MNNTVIRQLNLTRGIVSLKIPSFIGTENLFKDAIKYATQENMIQKGDNIVCIMGVQEESPDHVNIIKVSTV